MKNFKLLLFASCFSLIFFSACSDDDPVNEFDCTDYEWAYEGEDDPSSWSFCFGDCSGSSQSPIAITGEPATSALTDLNYDYQDAPIDILNNGHTIEFMYPEGSNLTINGTDFSLLQFHFHTQSEHTVNGTRFPMETHLVHQNSAGDLAVVSVLFVEGTENEFLKNFSDQLPNNEGEQLTATQMVNIGDLIPTTGGFYGYSGSLTTPPCSEGVDWMVMKQTVEASAEQIANFSSILNNNYRPTQALNGRPIADADCSLYNWSYEGNTGPSTWHNCHQECGGNIQSPIDVSTSITGESLSELVTDYEAASINLFNNGRTVEFTYEAGSKLNLNGEDYDLLQFHFHTVSEHTINGEHFPMEAHLVHQNATSGNIAVVGIFFQEGLENEFLANFSNNYPSEENDVYTTSSEINVLDLLPSSTSYFTYGGSLTTPPCSETVTWFLMQEPVVASAQQINDMAAILQSNNRPVQALNGRKIEKFN
ncbi:UNVERIFIED_CONTAM: hypothetical protein GTU68_027641 [Idotea baltica]|nr:hypothetical protein [Idotea baltica]